MRLWTALTFLEALPCPDFFGGKELDSAAQSMEPTAGFEPTTC